MIMLGARVTEEEWEVVGKPTKRLGKRMVGTWGLEPQTSTVSRFGYPIPPTNSMFALRLLSASKYA
jgi:hypothetical protein